MCKYSRRSFMAHSATAGLAAWQADQLFAADSAPAAAPAAKGVDMTIAKWSGPAVKDATDAEIPKIATKLVEQAIEGLGGMKRFVKKGDVVWVKPNIAWDSTPELAGNTNPQIVAALVKMCFDAGAKTVKVGDNSVQAAAKTYESSGIAAAAKPLGAEVVFLDKNRYQNKDIQGERIKSLMLYPDILDCDLVINVPIAKHHVLSNATLAMKNYMGVMDNRQPFHQDFATCLTDLTRFMQKLLHKDRQCLTVLDAVRTLVRNGPTGGKPEYVVLKNTVAAGVDIVALDALGVELLGKDPAEMKKANAILKFAQEAGLGKINYRSLALKEIAVA